MLEDNETPFAFLSDCPSRLHLERDVQTGELLRIYEKDIEEECLYDPLEEELSDLVSKGRKTASLEEMVRRKKDDELESILETLPSVTLDDKPVSWAHRVTSLPSDYDQIRAAREYPFELDAFQKQAIYWLERRHSVFVAAHTSAGKTVVAEYAIALAMQHGTKAIYTSPIKALSNQKYRDFRETFGEASIGLLTGDIQINAEADCLIMTTEILRSMLYRGAELIAELEFVIFDEVHYVNDLERGVVWEEVLIMLPPHIQIILLSATVPNVMEFADWVGRQRKTPVYVVSTSYRPVPLVHHLYCCNRELIPIANQKEGFLTDGYKQALTQIKTGKNAIRNARQQGTLWSELIYVLKKQALLPCVVFVFSRRGCEDSADACQSMTLTDATERASIHMFMDQSLAILSAQDSQLPQILRMREMMERGIAVHHSGLLPILKECVEMLFGRGSIKVLFATETFAMGVNMPARTVVFGATRKHDGLGFRQLTCGEYTQMAGRAGRRGKDPIGTVIIIPPQDEAPSESGLRDMILGTATRLASRFRLTYNMILSLLRVESIKIEEMIKRSFGENAVQKNLPEERGRLDKLESLLKEKPALDCLHCVDVLESLYETDRKLRSNSASLFPQLVSLNKASRYFETGRILVVNHKGVNCAAQLKGINPDKTLRCTVNEVSGKVAPLRHVSKQLGKLISTDISAHQVLLISKHRCMQDDVYFWEQECWDEITLPLSTVLEIDTQILNRRRLFERYQRMTCPDWLEHFQHFSERAVLANEVSELKFKLSDFGLALLPEYMQRLEVLKTLGYLDAACTVTLKGRVACEINTANELLTTELIFDNAFREMSPAQMAALMSCMVFQEKERQEGDIFMEKELAYLEGMVERLSDIQREHGMLDVSRESSLASLNPSLMHAVYAWCTGMPFIDLIQLTPILEGSIVRCIVRLGETMRELRSAGKLIGDPVLVQKAEQADEAMKRDICFAASLYYQ